MSTETNPTHNYATADIFNVTLTVTDNDGASASASTSAEIRPATYNQPPIADAGGPYSGVADELIQFTAAGSTDPDGNIVAYLWDFGDSTTSTEQDPTHVYSLPGDYTVSLTVTDNGGASDSTTTLARITDICSYTLPDISINSTSQAGCPLPSTVEEQTPESGSSYSILAINDLGMHCGDLDTRVMNILPPFQVLLSQVIRKGEDPEINPDGISVYYSAASNPNDPAITGGQVAPRDGLLAGGSTYKTNFWDSIEKGLYDPFYPGGTGLTPLTTGGLPVTPGIGLPVPNVEDLYIGSDGIVGGSDTLLTAVQHAMPGGSQPYKDNVPQLIQEHYDDKPVFISFPFGYVAEGVNWHEAAGIPFAAFDDLGRENPYPLVRVEAQDGNGNTLASVDTVLPISGEANCAACHADNMDYKSIMATENRSDIPAITLAGAGLKVASSLEDPDSNMPPRVSLEYASDINILRLHDLKHGMAYVRPSADGTTEPAPCNISAGSDSNGDANCLAYQALVQDPPTPVACQTCHYSPALDLAQVGPMTGPPGSIANGRNQLSHASNSRVMHHFHGTLVDSDGNDRVDRNGLALFPNIAPPQQDSVTGLILNQNDRLDQMENNCYQCHPGKNVQCLRGAMFNGAMLCSDCHGNLEQVGDDFSHKVSPDNPGDFELTKGNFYDPGSTQKRVPWANEPGCGSCHTGDANNNLASLKNTIENYLDAKGNVDGIRLRQAFRTGDAKATPIVPTNHRFSEPLVPTSFNGFANPGAGNPQLYRMSTGHGGVMCEGCHGATHAEWPNGNPNSNDNVAAMQLQGHTGTITDCDTCHDTAALPRDTHDGPHGMHLVDDIRYWKEGHKDAAKRENGRAGSGSCGACHGSDHLGTVLSRAAEDRAWNVESRVRRVALGEPVACDVCHSLEKSFGR